MLLVDCMYKTNLHKTSLFAMLGIISTRMTFWITHYFMHKELKDNFQLALYRMKMLFVPHDLPKVFVIDREFAIINAIKFLFPETWHMLCAFHISRNMQQHCKEFFKSENVWEKIIKSWINLTWVTSQTEFFEG